MERNNAFAYFEQKKEFLFPNKKYSETQIENALFSASDDSFFYLDGIDYKKPTTIFIISIFLGSLGIDRFYLGDMKFGILKLISSLVLPFLPIWWIIDLFLIKNLCREKNCELLIDTIKNHQGSTNTDFAGMYNQTNLNDGSNDRVNIYDDSESIDDILNS